MIRVEICVDSVDGALAAQRGGADRVELCANLKEGGTTPSAGAIRLARKHLRVDVQVMIRPRGGDFLYTDAEMEIMREDIRAAKDLGANGVVFGCLTVDGDIDETRTAGLIALARPLNVTFHRAFDMCREPRAALETLVALGVDRVLTSGQRPSCLLGLELIRELQELARGRIILMAGGGITPANVVQLVKETGIGEVHLSAGTSVPSGMRFRNPDCFMGAGSRDAEFTLRATDEQVVRDVVETLRRF
jgi:copper homeostasis protein